VSIKDGLSAIANEVLGDVQKEAELIIVSAENQAKETLKVGKEHAVQNYQTLMNRAIAKAEGERRKIDSTTEVEMRNRLLQTKEALVDLAFDQALDKLKDFTTTEKYQSYLLKLIEDVAGKIGQKNLVLQVNGRDKGWLTQDMLNRLSKKLRCEIKLSEQTENFIGGCRIETLDGKIAYDSTIDNRLKELKPTLRVKVAKILFEKEA
jgi:V/A-type H+/Na+-transporting ATPase subunit E